MKEVIRAKQILFLVLIGLITFITVTSRSFAAEEYSFVLQWGSQGSGDGQFLAPTGVAVDSENNVYVVDPSRQLVQKFTSDGTFITKWGSYGSGDGQFAYPYCIAVDSNTNEVYIADQTNHRVQKFTSDGTFITKWGTKGVENGQFWFPFGIAVDLDGNVYVADIYTRIQKFRSDGTFLAGWSVLSSGSGYIWGLAVDYESNVYAADFYGNRICKYTSDGNFLKEWGTQGYEDGQFSLPNYVAVDSTKNVYVTDHVNDRVQKFTSDGIFITKWGSSGSGDGQFNYPMGIAVDSEGNVYVADQTTQRIQKFAPSASNNAPIAYAGPDQTVNEGTSVMLDGSGSSDPESDPLTHSWSQVAGSEVTLDTTDPVHPTFAPWVAAGGETLTFKLIVNDGKLDSDPDYVDITVKNVNNPPVADAGDNQSVQEDSPVTLDGSASYDNDNEPLTYSWVQTADSSVTLSGHDTASPYFTAPLVGSAGETLTFELTVDDGIDTATDTVDVLVENVNHPPIADAGDDQTVDEGTSVMLDGSGSSDPDNDPLTYAWTQIGGFQVTLSNSDTASPTFTAPSGADTLRFQLIVKDGELNSEPDVVIITVLASNDPPACELGQASPDRFWPPNHKMVPVEIVGVTDPDNDQATITVTGVTQDEPVNNTGDGDTGPDAVIQDDTLLLRAERAGDGNGRVYQVTFTADDDAGGTCSGTVTVCVPHDRKDTGCVNDGQYYNSLQP